MEGSNARVRVIVRVRPLRDKEKRDRSVKEIVKPPLNNSNDQTLSIYDPASLLAGVRSELIDSWAREFTFDKCLWSNDSQSFRYARQETLFEEVGQPILSWIFDGFNCCVFAFGQTGSGKTYSMMGDLNRGAEQYGLIPRICFSIFDRVEQLGREETGPSEVSVTFSHMEIYNEAVVDLLASAPPPGKRQASLRIREHPKHGVFVQDLTRVRVASFEEILGLIAIGDKNRTVAMTRANSHSSRSHAVVTLTIVQRARQQVMTTDGLPTTGAQRIEGRVHLVDLAGSERVALSGARNTRLKEACSINKSLSVLADVILSLSSGKRRHVPYRNSAITMVLKDSLGGNAHAIMVATVSPSNFDYEETISTLKYADRAKKVRMRVDANISSGLQATDTSAVEMVPLLQAEVQKLKEMLAAQQQANEYIDRVAQLEKQLEEREQLIHSLSHQQQIRQGHSQSAGEVANRNNPGASGELTVSTLPSLRRQGSGASQGSDEEELDLVAALEGAGMSAPAEPSSAPATATAAGAFAATGLEGGNIGVSPAKKANQLAKAAGRPTQAVLAEDASDLTTPRLVNLNQDPLFTECLVFYLPPDTKVVAGSRPGCYVPLSAHDVLPDHCEIWLDKVSQEVFASPSEGALVFVNGTVISRPTALSTFDRISLGRFHLFRFERKDMRTTTAAGKGKAGAVIDPTLSALVPGWEFAQQELLVKNNYFQSLPSSTSGTGGVPSPAAAVAAIPKPSAPTQRARTPSPSAITVKTPSIVDSTPGTNTVARVQGADKAESNHAFTSEVSRSNGLWRAGEGEALMRYVPVLDSPHLSLKLPAGEAYSFEKHAERGGRDRHAVTSGLQSGSSSVATAKSSGSLSRRHTINRLQSQTRISFSPGPGRAAGFTLSPQPHSNHTDIGSTATATDSPMEAEFKLVDPSLTLDGELQHLEEALDQRLLGTSVGTGAGVRESYKDNGLSHIPPVDSERERGSGSPIVNLTNSPRSPSSTDRKARGSLSALSVEMYGARDKSYDRDRDTAETETDEMGHMHVSVPKETGEVHFWDRVNAVAEGAEKANPHELRQMLKMVMERAENTGTSWAGTSGANSEDPPCAPQASTRAPLEQSAPPAPPASRRFVSRLAGDVRPSADNAGGTSSIGGAFVPVGGPSKSSSGNSAGKDAFEAEALKLKKDLQSMQSALNDRMMRYKGEK